MFAISKNLRRFAVFQSCPKRRDAPAGLLLAFIWMLGAVV